jgi:hypothetical protein
MFTYSGPGVEVMYEKVKVTNHTDYATKRTNCPFNRQCGYCGPFYDKQNPWNPEGSGLVLLLAWSRYIHGLFIIPLFDDLTPGRVSC